MCIPYTNPQKFRKFDRYTERVRSDEKSNENHPVYRFVMFETSVYYY